MEQQEKKHNIPIRMKENKSPSAAIHKINTFKRKTINKLIIRHHHKMTPTQRKISAGEMSLEYSPAGGAGGELSADVTK